MTFKDFLLNEYCFNLKNKYECHSCTKMCKGHPYKFDNNSLCFDCLTEINEVKNQKIKEENEKKHKKLQSMFDKKESYKHRCAKEIFKEWCQQKNKFELIDENGRSASLYCDNQPHRITFNYPITKLSVSPQHLWDEMLLKSGNEQIEDGYVPTFDECIENGVYPIAIADIMIPHKGSAICFIEIVCNKKKTPITKIKKVASLLDYNTDYYEIDADWILKQTEIPNIIKARFLYYDQQTASKYSKERKREQSLKNRLKRN
jgi:hypothetical protein